MDPDLHADCLALFRALAIIAPDRLRVQNEEHRHHPDQLGGALVIAIYTGFYCHATATTPAMPRSALTHALKAANCGASASDQPNAYIARGPAPPSDTDWVRCYWNLDPPGTIELMAQATAALGRAAIPFRLKVLLDVTLQRRDAAVLYLPGDAWPAAAPHVAATAAVLDQAGLLRPGTPLFTKPLRPGLGFAEDPGTGASFGMHRSALVARAMAKGYLRNRRDPAAQWALLQDEFSLEGLALAQPFLNPGSQDSYAL